MVSEEGFEAVEGSSSRTVVPFFYRSLPDGILLGLYSRSHPPFSADLSVRLFLPNRPVTGKGATKDKATSMITQRYLQEGIVFFIKKSAYCSSQYIIDGLIRRNTLHTIALHEDSYQIANLGLLEASLMANRSFLPQSELCGFVVELLCLRDCII
jgi:hypothetical protein